MPNPIALTIRGPFRLRQGCRFLVDPFAGLAMFDHQRHDIEIDEAIRRIKDFHVATDWPAALRQRLPIKAADALVESFTQSGGPTSPDTVIFYMFGRIAP